MRCSLAVAAIVVLLVTVGRAEDDPVLPFNPFTNAKEGDWETMLFNYGSPEKPNETEQHISTWRVKKVTETEVQVDLETIRLGGDGKPEIMKRTFPRKGELKLRDYFKAGATETYKDSKTFDKKLTLEGHTFDGKQIDVTYKSAREEGKLSLVMAPEVKGQGTVCLEVFHANGKMEQFVVAGYGTATKKLWGKKADEVAIVDGRDKENLFRFNLYQDARHGFSIHVPGFREIQERQVAQVITVSGEKTSLGVIVQNDPTPRKEYGEKSSELIKNAGYKLVKKEEKKVSGKDALQVEYTGEAATPAGPVKFRIVDLFVFSPPFVIDVRATSLEKNFDGGELEKALRQALAGLRLIDIGGGGDGHKGESPKAYFDHRYGYVLPLPELPRPKEPQNTVEFQGAVELNGNTSRVSICVLEKKSSPRDFPVDSVTSREVVSKKEVEVSGKKALRIETKGESNGKPVQGLTLIVFDEERTYVVDAFGAKAAWDEEGEAFRESVASFALKRK